MISKKKPNRKKATQVGRLFIYHAHACILDRLADAELQHGHHVRAEQLARRAADLREGVAR